MFGTQCPRLGARLFLPALIVVLAGSSVAAQERRLVRGTVRNAVDGTPVGDALILELPTHSGHATTGADGRFSVTLRMPTARILVARIGFRPDTVAVPAPNERLDVQLQPAPLTLDPIVVAAERVATVASSTVIRQLDLALRPRESSQEVLRLVPGLVIAQHAGGGKAEQIFLRGFDADHGTDVAVSVDGTPVNLVSHAHGQGYADLHFLMPEVIEAVEVRKGPHDPRDGDLATAGAVELRTVDRIPAPFIETRGGSFGTVHLIGAAPFGARSLSSGGYFAAAAHYTDGPFLASQDYRRANFFGKWTAPFSASADFVGTISGYEGAWNATGQVPSRAVVSGKIPRFGSVDPSEGGRTSRYEVSGALRSTGDQSTVWNLRAYAVRYRLDLFSDFTFFRDDPINGDGIEQRDRRYLIGWTGDVTQVSKVAGIDGRTGFGAGLRSDFADLLLAHQRQGTRLETRLASEVSEQHGYLWFRQEWNLSRDVRLELGARGDVFRFDVADRTNAPSRTAPRPDGTRWQGRVSPKANLSVRVSDGTTVFASVGLGFHSNDARDVVLAGRGQTVLPRAGAAELGLRHSSRRGSISAALWAMDLESELVFSGDEGTTEATGRTRRRGLDLEGRMQLTTWLWADADLNFSRGRLRDAPDSANRIPLAPTFTSTGGFTVRDVGPVSGGLRFRHIGGRAANEDGRVQALGATVAELFGRWRLGRVELLTAVDNLFNVQWNEAQFATTSRLRGEAEPVTELHFTPGAPRSVQVGLRLTF